MFLHWKRRERSRNLRESLLKTTPLKSHSFPKNPSLKSQALLARLELLEGLLGRQQVFLRLGLRVRRQ